MNCKFPATALQKRKPTTQLRLLWTLSIPTGKSTGRFPGQPANSLRAPLIPRKRQVLDTVPPLPTIPIPACSSRPRPKRPRLRCTCTFPTRQTAAGRKSAPGQSRLNALQAVNLARVFPSAGTGLSPARRVTLSTAFRAVQLTSTIQRPKQPSG